MTQPEMALQLLDRYVTIYEVSLRYQMHDNAAYFLKEIKYLLKEGEQQ